MDAPIFIVGTGRCGSTLFHDLMTQVGSFYWLTQLVNRKPHVPRRNAVAMRLLHVPLGTKIAHRVWHPVEAYPFWERHCPGFSKPFRDLTAEDVTERAKVRMREGVAKAIPDGGRRPIFKITGWPRMRLLKEIWPSAEFIHIVRDGRAVTNSVLAAPYFDGWAGPQNWARGGLNARQRRLWRQSNYSFVALAAFGWENRMAAFRAAERALGPKAVLTIRYEDLCADALGAMRRALEFCGDVWTPRQERAARRFAVKNTNAKYQSDLTDHQREILEVCLESSLREWGYA